MEVFGNNGKRGLKVFGPMASVDVKVTALGSVVDSSWILVNFSAGAREIVDVKQCFNDVSFIYALGNNQSSCLITMVFAIFIGNRNCEGGNNTAAIASGFGSYVENRISTSKGRTPGEIAIGKFSRKGWLTGIDIGQPDPEKGICYGTVHFIMKLK